MPSESHLEVLLPIIHLATFAAGMSLGAALRAPLIRNLAAENVFLRTQLTALLSRGRPKRLGRFRRLVLLGLSRVLDSWKDALFIVQPATLIRWHRDVHRWVWKWRSTPGPGRPPVPEELRELIRLMARQNPSWGEERIADELELKLGIEVSPRTVRRCLPKNRPRPGLGGPGWSEFLRLHAGTVLAVDFFTMPTLNAFRSPSYVFVLMELTSRRILHINVTSHPSAEWVVQQLREALPCLHPYRFLIHDRDSIFSKAFRAALTGFGIKSLRTPPRTPTANAFCERLIGTIRRECLDYVIALNEGHLRRILQDWMRHYNQGRPHSSLGPGLPDPSRFSPPPPAEGRHRIADGSVITSRAVLGGLHQEYRLEQKAA